MTDPSQYFNGRTVQEQMTEVIGYVDTRAAEVATDAIASDVAQVHQDKLDADGYAQAAAASASAAAGTLANAVKKTGEASQSIEGDVNLSTGDLGVAGDASVGGDLGITGNLGVTGTATVPAPVNNTDAANKKYVDDALDNYAAMVRIANNQNVTGDKTDTYIAAINSGSAAPHGWINKTNIDTSAVLDSGNRYVYAPALVDANGKVLCAIRIQQASSGGGRLIFSLASTRLDGTLTLKQLGEYNQTSDSWS